MTGKIHSRIEGMVATVTIENHGRLNALSQNMWKELRAAFEKISGDGSLRCVVIRGAGDEAFAAGADIAAFEKERFDIPSAKAYGVSVHTALDAIEQCPHPVIAMIKGPCVGGGLEIASRCDMRICGQSSRFGIPVNRLGAVVAYQEMRPLVAVAGPATALEILLEGRVFNAEEAEKKGIVNRIVADAQVEKEAYATAGRIADGAPLVARWHKKFVRRLLDPKPLSEAELEDNYACFATEDYQTGFRSFLEKKKPVFKSR